MSRLMETRALNEVETNKPIDAQESHRRIGTNLKDEIDVSTRLVTREVSL